MQAVSRLKDKNNNFMKLQEKLKKEILPALQKKFNYKNIMAVPTIKKVVVNVGVGKHTKEKNFTDNVVSVVTRITGQKPILTKAKKSISTFKVREGQVVGVVVTLRGAKMYDFLDKLINVTFPRIRDFRGISADHVDRTGNLTIGFKENVAFPEVRADEVENVHGLEISIATTAGKKEVGLELFKAMGFPFKKD